MISDYYIFISVVGFNYGKIVELFLEIGVDLEVWDMLGIIFFLFVVIYVVSYSV